MLRFLFNVVVVILLIAIISGSYLWYKRGPLLARYLATQLDLPVCIDDFQIGWRYLEVKNITVKNPDGGPVPVLFAAGSISADVSISAFLRRRIEIPTLTINSCIIGMELFNRTGTDNSWTRAFDISPSSVVSTPTLQGKLSHTTGRRVVIDDLMVNNLYLNLYNVAQQRRLPLHGLKSLELTNVGGGVGMPLGSATELLFEQLVTYIFESFDLSEILIETIGAKSNPYIEVPIRLGAEALKREIAPSPVPEPNIPLGKYCYTP